MLAAIAVYALVAIAEPFVESWLHRVFEHNAPFQWAWDLFFAPLLRAAMIVVFVFFAYPALFGLSSAPTLSELLAVNDSRLNHLFSLLFVASIFLPFIPAINRAAELLLPLQAALATAVIFVWLSEYLGITSSSIWPGIHVIGIMIVLSFLSYRLARSVAEILGHWVDQKFYLTDGEAIVFRAVLLLSQVPVILFYGFGLGRQIAI